MSLSKPLTLKKVAEDLGYTNSEVCRLCFTATNNNGYFKCNLCPIIRKKGNGNNNLTSHLEGHELDIVKDFLRAAQADKKGPMHTFTRNLSKDAKDYHDWIEWVVMGDHPSDMRIQ